MGEDEATALGAVVDKFYVSQGWQPLEGEDHDTRIQVWWEVLAAARVPHDRFNDCYLIAVADRVGRRRAGEDIFPLSADDLVIAWGRILDKETTGDRVNGRLLLEANSTTLCQRCFGKGVEVRPDLSTRRCSHEPITAAEKAEYDAARIAQVRILREANAKIGNPAPVVAPVKKSKPRSVRLQCTVCKRKVSGAEGWVNGETCGDLLNHEPRVVCEGVMRVSDDAIAARGV